MKNKKRKITDGVKNKKSQRLQILSENEIAELYAVPQFNAVERKHYFLLPEKVVHSLKIMKTNGKNTSSKLWFILQYGYFKARHQFFNIHYGHVKEDLSFIMEQYLPNDCMPNKLPSIRVKGLTKSSILKWAGYSNNMSKARLLVIEKVGHLAKITYRVTEIFDKVIQFLESEKMVLPSYSHLQDIIGQTLKAEEKRLIDMMKRHLKKKARQSLQELFTLRDGLYRITELKLDAKILQTKEMQSEISKLTLCYPIYVFSKKFLPILGLSRSIIKYYADLAKLYYVDRLAQIPRELAYLYLICYVHGR